MKKVLVFDLDDTLYPEIEFVKSGFKAVADFLNKNFGISGSEAFVLMNAELKNGRGAIFDKVLKNFGIESKRLVNQSVSVYRKHSPDIALSPDAIRCLNRFKAYPKYLVTDGNKIVQGNKVKVLGLNKIMNHCFITHRYGVHNSKPSPYCFLKICARESVAPSNVLYIGDNPNKDFVGIKPLGFRTVRILKGPFKDSVFEEVNNADQIIHNLDEITEEFIELTFK